MQKFMKAIAAIMLMMTVVIATGCTKPDDPNNPNNGGSGGGNGGDNNVYYTISVLSNPTEGGTVSGGGSFVSGASHTVSANVYEGYTFTNWTENGNEVSTSASYHFTVNANRTLVANFSALGQSEGNGTAEDPYNVAASIGLQSDEPIAWVHGYIVGAVKSGLSSVSSNADINWSAPFDLATNVVIADDATCNEISQCLIVNLPTGKPLRSQVNLKDNPGNLGKHLAVCGKLRSYFGQAGLRDSNGTEADFILETDAPNQYTISVSAIPSVGGTVSGGGTFLQGQSCTLDAVPNANYTFTNWTENGELVSTNANYTFNVTDSRNFVANFTYSPQSFTITVSAQPANGGTVSGGGTYTCGQSCTVHATANNGYTFTYWTENGNPIYTNANYSFTVTGNLSLVAHFQYNTQAPIGAINGLFSISANKQVFFSQGNLQYNARKNSWRFATNQYDYIGSNNSNISSTYNGWIDLFGWGTSGWDCGNTYYHPWNSERGDGSLYGPPYMIGLSGSNSDWGHYNAISNGGNQAGLWRTLRKDEWNYVFNKRSTTSGIRYAKALVDNVKGVILLPDDWSRSYYTLNMTNQSGASFNSNVIFSSTWTSSLESHGAVFLPAAGYRDGTTVSNVGVDGRYWSASPWDLSNAIFVDFNIYSIETTMSYHPRSRGHSVRLVCPVE